MQQMIRWWARALLGVTLLCLPLAAAAEGPTITRFVACADVAEKDCVGEGQRFGLDVGTLWAYAVIENRGEPLPVEMVWRRDGKAVFTAELNVGRSRRWRTWSRKRVRKGDLGGWTVALQRADRPAPPLAVLSFALGGGPIPAAMVPEPPSEDAPPPPSPTVGAPAPPRPPPVEPPSAVDAPSPPPADPAPPAPPAPAPAPPARVQIEPPDAPVAPPQPPQPSIPVETPPPAPPAAPPAPEPIPATPAPAPSTRTPPPMAPVASTAPAEGTVCRAWANIRRDGADGPIYQTLDVRIGARTTAEVAPGLVVGAPETLWALASVPRTVREQGPGGVVDREWDMLLGRDLTTGAKRVWAGFPATMAPPEKGEASRFEQTHRLVVRSVLGTYVGLTATLRRVGPRGERIRARALTVAAPGLPPPKRVADAALAAAFAGLPAARRPDPANVAVERFAFMNVDGRAMARAFAPCCGRSKGEPVSVDVPVDPTALAAGVDTAWRFVGGDGCVIHGQGGRVQAGRAGVEAALGPKGAVLLGVTWVPVNHPHRAAAQQRAVQTLR